MRGERERGRGKGRGSLVRLSGWHTTREGADSTVVAPYHPLLSRRVSPCHAALKTLSLPPFVHLLAARLSARQACSVAPKGVRSHAFVCLFARVSGVWPRRARLSARPVIRVGGSPCRTAGGGVGGLGVGQEVGRSLGYILISFLPSRFIFYFFTRLLPFPAFVCWFYFSRYL